MTSAREQRLTHEYAEMRKLRRPGGLINFYCACLTDEEAGDFLHSAVTMGLIRQRLLGFQTPEEFDDMSPGQVPDKYLVQFTCTGLVWSEPARDAVESKEHWVEIVYGLDYPERPPSLVWLTQIWHPNIKPPHVCTVGRPFAVGTLLSQLCLMIGRMVQYQVYNVESPLNHEAAEWASRNERRFPVDLRDLVDGRIHERPDVSSLVQLVGEETAAGPLVELL